jgi:hypothetical protein
VSAPAIAVRERPILFSGAMVRALLDGSKTQTRRVVTDFTSQGNWKPSQCDLTTAWVDPGPSPAGNPGPYLKAHVTARADDGIVDRIYPRWFPGDRLWVRETWKLTPMRATCTAPTRRSVRVQDISEADAVAEGIAAYAEAYMAKGNPRELTPVEQYQYLWDSLNAPRGYGWDANPWVWVLEFRRVG